MPKPKENSTKKEDFKPKTVDSEKIREMNEAKSNHSIQKAYSVKIKKAKSSDSLTIISTVSKTISSNEVVEGLKKAKEIINHKKIQNRLLKAHQKP
jgi:hypothetical protein